MSRRAPSLDIREADIEVGGAESSAAGLVAVAVSMKRAIDPEQLG